MAILQLEPFPGRPDGGAGQEDEGGRGSRNPLGSHTWWNPTGAESEGLGAHCDARLGRRWKKFLGQRDASRGNARIDQHRSPGPREAGSPRKQTYVGWAIPSEDGKHLAIWEATGGSNAWLLELPPAW